MQWPNSIHPVDNIGGILNLADGCKCNALPFSLGNFQHRFYKVFEKSTIDKSGRVAMRTWAMGQCKKIVDKWAAVFIFIFLLYPIFKIFNYSFLIYHFILYYSFILN